MYAPSDMMIIPGPLQCKDIYCKHTTLDMDDIWQKLIILNKYELKLTQTFSHCFKILSLWGFLITKIILNLNTLLWLHRTYHISISFHDNLLFAFFVIIYNTISFWMIRKLIKIIFLNRKKWPTQIKKFLIFPLFCKFCDKRKTEYTVNIWND